MPDECRRVIGRVRVVGRIDSLPRSSVRALRHVKLNAAGSSADVPLSAKTDPISRADSKSHDPMNSRG